MWWRSHALFAVLCAGLTGFALSGCGFQPLYGGSTVGGAKLKEVMASVDVVPIPGRVGGHAAAHALDDLVTHVHGRLPNVGSTPDLTRLTQLGRCDQAFGRAAGASSLAR